LDQPAARRLRARPSGVSAALALAVDAAGGGRLGKRADDRAAPGRARGQRADDRARDPVAGATAARDHVAAAADGESPAPAARGAARAAARLGRDAIDASRPGPTAHAGAPGAPAVLV